MLDACLRLVCRRYVQSRNADRPWFSVLQARGAMPDVSSELQRYNLMLTREPLAML